MAGATGSDVDRRRYGTHQRHAEPRFEAVESGASDRAGGKRNLPAREPQARRARIAARLRVRSDRRAAEAGGCHRFNRGSDRNTVTHMSSRRTFVKQASLLIAGAYV